MNSFICPTCYMTFRSTHFLTKHKERFCVGEVGPPQNASERIRDLRRRHERHRLTQTLGKAQVKQQSLQTRPQHQLQKPNSEPTADGSDDRCTEDLAHIVETEAEMSKSGKQQNEQRTSKENKQGDETDCKQHGAAPKEKASQLERILIELRTQEQRITELLQTLVDHLQQNPTEPMQGILQRTNPHLHIPNVGEIGMQNDMPVYGCGVLSSEISSLHLSYLQSGGKDSHILANLQDLLSEAIKVEMEPDKTPLMNHQHERAKRPKYSKRHFSRELISTEQENKFLEEEILKLQLRRRSTQTQPTPRSWPSEKAMRTVKMDIEMLKQEIEINRLRRQIRSRQAHVTFPALDEPSSQTPALLKYPVEVSDGLGPAPYDPMAGFVVFYDFLLGLSPSYRTCGLMVGIYSGEKGLGSSAMLPLVYCEPLSMSTHSPLYSPGQKAIFATKQAVPQIQPAPSMALVMQIQASGGYDVYGQEITNVTPRGWVKLDIFDYHSRVISGRWKIPVRMLPAKPSMTAAETNAVPQLGNAELYLRIVNARDSETQSSVPISISSAGIYRYPQVATARYCIGREDCHEDPLVQSAPVHLTEPGYRSVRTV